MERKRFLGGLLAAAGAPAAARAVQASADLIVVGGTIHTVDGGYKSPEAFAVSAGRFSYVGSIAGAMALRGAATQVLDASGHTVLPGLIDAHLHLTRVGFNLSEVDLYHSYSFEQVVERTAAFARTSPDPWILGDGWDQNLWQGQRFPTHAPLSAAIPDRPVALSRVDGHAVLANAKAMAIAGVGRSTQDPPGGRIFRDAAGNPTGVFLDSAQALIYSRVPNPTRDQLVRATRAAITECNRWGVTAVAEPGSNDAVIAAHTELIEREEYSIRNYVMLSDDPNLIDAHLRGGIVDGAYNGRLWTRAIKMFADGALGSRGAALLAPYADDPKNLGLIVTSQSHVVAVTERALRAGFQVGVHAIGDRANRMVLDAYETALTGAGRPGDPRLRIEHVQVIEGEDLPRLSRLGIIPSMQTTHQISDMAWAEARLGPQRVLGAYAWRSLLDTGVIVASGTDAPVESVNTLRTFHAAITRQNEENQPLGGWYPKQKMTREEALASMTIWAAHANFQERVLGSITPGKYADFVVMDRDWMRVAPEEIMQTKILSTYFGGRRVYDGSDHDRVTLRPRRARACCDPHRPSTGFPGG
jgi:predicted amidohydrolase YtcJ